MSLSPKDGQAYLLGARANLQLNMNALALNFVELAEGHGSPRPAVDPLRLMVAAQQGEAAAAEQLLSHSGVAALPSEAYEAIVRCAQYHAQMTRARLVLDQLEQAGEFPAVVAYQRGRNCEITEELASATEYYEKAFQIQPRMTRAAFRAGVCYYKLRKFDRAEEMHRQALRQPYRVVSSIELANCLWEQNRNDEAARIISGCLDEPPAQLQMLYLQVDEYVDADRAALVGGRIHNALQNSQQAVELLHRVLAYNHRDFEARALLIKNLRLLDREQEANELTTIQTQMTAGRQRCSDLRIELADAPADDAETIDKRCELAELYWQVESVAEAKLELAEILKLDPNCERARRLLADIDREQASRPLEPATPLLDVR